MRQSDILWPTIPTAREQLAQELLRRYAQERAWAAACKQAKREAFWARWQLWIGGAWIVVCVVIAGWGGAS